VTVQGPVKKLQPDGMSHMGARGRLFSEVNPLYGVANLLDSPTAPAYAVKVHGERYHSQHPRACATAPVRTASYNKK